MRRRVATVALLFLAGAAPRPSDEPGSARRIGLGIVLLGVGPAGTRTLLERRLVVDSGMSLDLAESIERVDGEAARPARLILRVDTEEGGQRATKLRLDSEVRQADPDGLWTRSRDVNLPDDTSLVLELAPGRGKGERLVVSITVSDAPGEPVTLPLLPVDAEIGITVLDNNREMLLQRPHLRSFAGEPLGFSFEYPVPSAQGGSDVVSCEVTLTPGHPRKDRLPVRLSVAASFPAGGTTVLVTHEESALLTAGESWVVPVTAPGDKRTGFRLAIRVGWRRPGGWGNGGF